MSQTRICPNCKAEVPADAPAGVCPYCALRAGLGSDSATRSARGWGRPRSLPPEQLSGLLPELEGFELIGSGGMGTVYRARQRELGRPVAVKVLYSDLPDSTSFAERFTREARTLARLDHPNIVSVYDFGHREGLYYLVMELVDGATLRQTMEEGALEPKEALLMVVRICEALQYAHDNGVVHRDIKPENVLLDKKGSVKIADFGLAKLVGATTEPRLTAAEQVMGTPHYMAPEQIEKPAEVDHRADIYALGVVFYEMLTGELPVGRFPPPSHKVEIDVRLDNVVLRTLEKEPQLRYQRASDLQSDVESLSSPGFSPLDGIWRGEARREHGYREYRSAKTIWGLPLLHIAFRRGSGVARGIIAIGDVAIGGIALGGVSIGGIALGGVSFGLLGAGGVALGLLFAAGGVAVGGFANGGLAVGLAATGGQAYSLWTLAEESVQRVTILGWLLLSAAVIAGCTAGIRVVLKAAADKTDERIQ